MSGFFICKNARSEKSLHSIRARRPGRGLKRTDINKNFSISNPKSGPGDPPLPARAFTVPFIYTPGRRGPAAPGRDSRPARAARHHPRIPGPSPPAAMDSRPDPGTGPGSACRPDHWDGPPRLRRQHGPGRALLYSPGIGSALFAWYRSGKTKIILSENEKNGEKRRIIENELFFSK